MSFGITIREWWQWSYAQVVTFFYFDRVSRVGQYTIPDGPVLFIGTHRNGILDAMVYSNILGPMTFVLAKRLQASIIGKILFGGIGVVREKDGSDRSSNRHAMKECADHLAAGRRVFIFPEGTSALGPKLLEMKPGAAAIAVSALRKCPDLKVVPVAALYQRAWGFRSRVSVRIGRPIPLDDIAGLEKPERVTTLQTRMEASLRTLAGEYESCEEQSANEAAGNVASLSDSSDEANKSRLPEIETVKQAWAALDSKGDYVGALRYNRIPLIPPHGPLTTEWLTLIGLGPFVTFMAMVNAPVLIAARMAGTHLARSTNVVSLMRVSVGMPLMILWGLLTLGLMVWVGAPLVWLGSLGVSLIGLGAWDPVRRAWTLIANRSRRQALGREFDTFVQLCGMDPARI